MKKLHLLGVFITGVAILVASSGCHRKPQQSLLPIPPVTGPSMPENTGTPSGTPIPPEAAPTANPTGTPEGYGNYAALFSGPHNENRDKFSADIVYFDFDRANIKSSEESKLQDIATYFKGSTGDALTIEGNCDERGTEKYNLSLGERRALAAREYLINLGMDPQRIKTVTYGASKPADPGHDEEAWKKNRRDEFVLITPK